MSHMFPKTELALDHVQTPAPQKKLTDRLDAPSATFEATEGEGGDSGAGQSGRQSGDQTGGGGHRSNNQKPGI